MAKHYSKTWTPPPSKPADEPHWWKKRGQAQRQTHQGALVPEAGRCPKCGSAIVYNGNYFCEYHGESCDWALSSPARSERDKAICDAIGINYF